jgi:hypothetical protein
MQNPVESPAGSRAEGPLSRPEPLSAASPVESQPAPSAGLVVAAEASPVREIGGPPGPEPTRFGDWEKKGRCIDF